MQTGFVKELRKKKVKDHHIVLHHVSASASTSLILLHTASFQLTQLFSHQHRWKGFPQQGKERAWGRAGRGTCVGIDPHMLFSLSP